MRQNVWDLRVWGQRGLLSFVGGQALRHGVRDSLGPISQDWLRDAAKAWAAQALSSTGRSQIHTVVAAVASWSEHLRRRADRGADPAALCRKDVEAFLA